MGVEDAAGEPATDDPVAYFLQDLTYHGKTERTRDAYERVLRRYETFVTEQRGTSIRAATRRECMAWVHTLREECSP